eukprot:3036478-Pleurochrysis_carterae.AAC.1
MHGVAPANQDRRYRFHSTVAATRTVETSECLHSWKVGALTSTEQDKSSSLSPCERRAAAAHAPESCACQHSIAMIRTASRLERSQSKESHLRAFNNDAMHGVAEASHDRRYRLHSTVAATLTIEISECLHGWKAEALTGTEQNKSNPLSPCERRAAAAHAPETCACQHSRAMIRTASRLE